MKTFKLSVLPAAALVLLASCGGDGNSQKDKAAPQGAFTGEFSDGSFLSYLIIGDGTFWSTYGSSSNDIRGFIKGKFNADKGQFNLAYTDFKQPGNKIYPGSGTGTYTSSSLAGSMTEDGKTSTFRADALPKKNYDYKQPASLSSIVGKWSGKLLDQENGTLEIGSDGIFSGSASGGCKFTGRFFTTDVNVFNVLVTFGGAPCAFPGEKADGIGVATLLDGGKNQLTVAVITTSEKAGSLFYAER